MAMNTTATEAACAELLDPTDAGGMGLSIGLFFGVFISNLPQYVKLYQRKNSASVSFYMVCVGCLACSTQLGNAVILQMPDVQCCMSTWGPWTCMTQIMGTIQLIPQWACFIPFYAMALYYKEGHSEQTIKVANRLAWGMVIGHILMVAAIVVVVLVTGPTSKVSLGVALFLFGVCLIFTSLQWLPQIYEVYKAKDAGSLSLLMLLIQGPGCAILTYDAAGPEHLSPWTYLPYAAASLQMFITLFLGTYYDFVKWRASKRAAASDEKEGLLNGGNKSINNNMVPVAS